MWPYAALSLWHFAAFTSLETPARPYDRDHGAVIGKNAVGKRDLGTRPLQQRACDEYAEPQPRMLARRLIAAASPPRQIGLADPLDDVGGKSRPVVGDHDLDAVVVPPGVHLGRRAGEVERIFEDVADAVEDRRIACADRLLGGGDGNPHLDLDAEIAMRRDDLLDQRRQLHA